MDVSDQKVFGSFILRGARTYMAPRETCNRETGGRKKKKNLPPDSVKPRVSREAAITPRHQLDSLHVVSTPHQVSQRRPVASDDRFGLAGPPTRTAKEAGGEKRVFGYEGNARAEAGEAEKLCMHVRMVGSCE